MLRPTAFLSVLALGLFSMRGSLACSNGAATPVASSPEGEPGAHTRSPFDAQRAWKHMEEQVAFGPRPSGSGALERLRGHMTKHLEGLGLRVEREAFTDPTPVGDLDFVNLIVDLPPTVTPAEPAHTVILATHFDTKRGLPFTFVGANDGASGTAVLLELARVLTSPAAPKRDYTLRLLFLDGEEAIGDWDPIRLNNTYGSRHHAAQLAAAGQAKSISQFILLDMVGDADLKLTTDLNSHRRLLELIFQTAIEIGHGAHVNGTRQEILDDHLPFTAIGIPSVDLIDFEYGPGAGSRAYWHTEGDVLAHCSAKSLGVIGEIVLAVLPKLNR